MRPAARFILGLPARLAIGAIRWVYQKGVGRLLPPVCRFEPSCSNYTIQAMETHGFLKGGLMGAWRICRCHPLSRGGWDPVPGRVYSPAELAGYARKVDVPGYDEEAGAMAGEPPRESAAPCDNSAPATPPPSR